MKKLGDLAHTIVTAVLCGLVAFLCWNSYRQTQLVISTARAVFTLQQVEMLKLMEPCAMSEEPKPEPSPDMEKPEIEKLRSFADVRQRTWRRE